MPGIDPVLLVEQVLSNADLRAKYDQHGVEGLDVNFMDSAEFFSMLFGSDRFEHLLGELSLAQLTRCAYMQQTCQSNEIMNANSEVM